ncbi:MAG: glycine zipper 2TM domain-containing protein [Gammaproteobacteria bacterium]
MKKSHFFTLLGTFTIICSSASYASGGEGHGKKHHKHHHSEQARYYQEQPRYSPPQDPRSHQGLAGGVVGSVLGYEIGNGDPIATGLGAAAGSYLGNGVAGKR